MFSRNCYNLLDGRFQWLSDSYPKNWGINEQGIFWFVPSKGRDYWRDRDDSKMDAEAYVIELETYVLF